MRPLILPVGSSRTTTLPTRKRARATVSAGRSARRKRRIAKGLAVGGVNKKPRQSYGPGEKSNLRGSLSETPDRLRRCRMLWDSHGTRETQGNAETNGPTSVRGVGTGQRKHCFKSLGEWLQLPGYCPGAKRGTAVHVRDRWRAGSPRNRTRCLGRTLEKNGRLGICKFVARVA